MNSFFEDIPYEKLDQQNNVLVSGEYEGCSFISCDFSNFDFSGFIFSNCTFKDCNLSNVRLDGTTFRDVQLTHCKMMGTRFDRCENLLLTFEFAHCNLNYTNFYRLDLKSHVFKHCTFKEADFSECNLSQSTFDNCDLTDAVFDGTNLEKCDFRSAYNYRIDPNNNRIRNAHFSLNGLPGLLGNYQIKIEL